MLVFKAKNIIESMLKNSLFGVAETLYAIESYGFCFSLILGKNDLAYACFYETGTGSIECVTELSAYDSMMFGEVYDGKPPHIKRKQFITFCHEIGINTKMTDYYLTLLERCALGEKAVFPSLSGSTVPAEILGEVMECRRLLLSGDESGLLYRIAEIHSLLSDIDKHHFPFGYSHKPFNEAWNLNIKKDKRAKNFAEYIKYISVCATEIGRKIELGALLETIKEETIEEEQIPQTN